MTAEKSIPVGSPPRAAPLAGERGNKAVFGRLAKFFASFRKRAGNETAILKGALGRFLASIIGTVLAFLGQVVCSRLLGISEFGDYVYTLAWVAVLTTLGAAGFDLASLRYVGAYNGLNQPEKVSCFIKYALRRSLVISAGVAVLLALVVWLGSGRMGSHKAGVFWLACPLLILNIAILVSSCCLQGLKRVVLAVGLQTIARAILMTGVLLGISLFAGAGISATAAMLANIISAAATLAILWMALRGHIRPAHGWIPGGKELGEWRQVSRSAVQISAFQLVLSQVDVIMVGFLAGGEDVAVYAVASRVVILVNFGLSAIENILAPSIAELFARNQMAELQRLITFAARVLLGYALTAILALLVFGHLILRLFGARYESGFTILAILLSGQAISSFAGPVGFLLPMTGRQNLMAKTAGFSACLAIILNLILIPKFGARGAAMAMACAISFRCVALALFAKRRLGLDSTVFRHAGDPPAGVAPEIMKGEPLL